MPSKGRLAAAKRQRTDAERGIRRVAQNRRARHDYEILETFECGLSLTGAEVKSLRAGHISLQDAYGRFERDRARKLLLHREQLDELAGKVAQKSLTLVPLSVYFRDGRAKLELALARGRRQYDKRRAIAERDATREAERVMKEYQGR